MKKIACQGCGHRNEMSVAACVKCGSALTKSNSVQVKKQGNDSKLARKHFLHLYSISEFTGKTVDISRYSRYKPLITLLSGSLPVFAILPLLGVPPFSTYFSASYIPIFIVPAGAYIGSKINGYRPLRSGGFMITAKGKPLVFREGTISKFFIQENAKSNIVKIFVSGLDNPVILNFKSKSEFEKLTGFLESERLRADEPRSASSA